MRTAAILLCMLAVIAAPASSLRADPNTQARKTIQALYNKKNAAIARQDLETAVSVYANEFSYVDLDGNINPTTRDEQHQTYRHLFDNTGPGVKKITVRNRDTIVSAKSLGGGVVVVEKGDYTVTMTGENDRVLKQHTTGTYREFWTKQGATYLLTQSRVLAIHKSTLLDGEPVETPPTQ